MINDSRSLHGGQSTASYSTVQAMTTYSRGRSFAGLGSVRLGLSRSLLGSSSLLSCSLRCRLFSLLSLRLLRGRLGSRLLRTPVSQALG